MDNYYGKKMNFYPAQHWPAPCGGVLLLEVFFFILGQVNQAGAQNGRQHHGRQQENPGVRAYLRPEPSEGAGEGRLQAVGVAAGSLRQPIF